MAQDAFFKAPPHTFLGEDAAQDTAAREGAGEGPQELHAGEGGREARVCREGEDAVHDGEDFALDVGGGGEGAWGRGLEVGVQEGAEGDIGERCRGEFGAWELQVEGEGGTPGGVGVGGDGGADGGGGEGCDGKHGERGGRREREGVVI